MSPLDKYMTNKYSVPMRSSQVYFWCWTNVSFCGITPGNSVEWNFCKLYYIILYSTISFDKTVFLWILFGICHKLLNVVTSVLLLQYYKWHYIITSIFKSLRFEVNCLSIWCMLMYNIFSYKFWTVTNRCFLVRLSLFFCKSMRLFSRTVIMPSYKNNLT